MLLAIVNFNDKLWQAGWDWIKNTANGIKNAVKLIGEVMKLVFNAVKDKIKELIDKAGNWRKRYDRGLQKWNNEQSTSY